MIFGKAPPPVELDKVYDQPWWVGGWNGVPACWPDRLPSVSTAAPSFLTHASPLQHTHLLPPSSTKQCNLGTVSRKALADPCPKIDTERAAKAKAKGQPAFAATASGDGFRWPWQPK
jgi:hypothetical protein